MSSFSNSRASRKIVKSKENMAPREQDSDSSSDYEEESNGVEKQFHSHLIQQIEVKDHQIHMILSQFADMTFKKDNLAKYVKKLEGEARFLNQVNEDLNLKNIDLTRRIVQAPYHVKNLMKEVKKFKTKVDGIIKEKESLKKQNKEKDRKIESLKAMNKELKSKVSAYFAEKVDLKQELKDKNVEMRELKTANRRLEELKSEKTVEIEELNDQMKEMEGNFAQGKADLFAEIDELKNQTLHLDHRDFGLRVHVARLEDKVVEQKSAKECLEAKQRGIHRMIVKFEEMEELKKKIKQLEADNEFLQNGGIFMASDSWPEPATGFNTDPQPSCSASPSRHSNHELPPFQSTDYDYRTVFIP